jgi:hypothetical protein
MILYVRYTRALILKIDAYKFTFAMQGHWVLEVMIDYVRYTPAPIFRIDYIERSLHKGTDS